MFNQIERGSMVVIYSLCIVGGPTLAPVIGSAVSESYLTWRWTEYLCVILSSVVLVINFFYLPETSAPAILTKKAKNLRLRTGRWALHSKHEEADHSIQAFIHKTLALPLIMLVKEPMVTLITTWVASSILS
jgi:DHA1 family multidrug resistance protein-like MFS transporter